MVTQAYAQANDHIHQLISTHKYGQTLLNQCSPDCDLAWLSKPLPRQANQERIHLAVGEFDPRTRHILNPRKVTFVQSPHSQPDAKPIGHQHLQTIGTPIGEEIRMMCLRRTKHRHDLTKHRMRLANTCCR